MKYLQVNLWDGFTINIRESLFACLFFLWCVHQNVPFPFMCFMKVFFLNSWFEVWNFYALNTLKAKILIFQVFQGRGIISNFKSRKNRGKFHIFLQDLLKIFLFMSFFHLCALNSVLSKKKSLFLVWYISTLNTWKQQDPGFACIQGGKFQIKKKIVKIHF